MKLTETERKIIENYKSKIYKQYPNQINRIIVFGSKARGDATEKSDIDIMIIVSDYNWRFGDEIRSIGYELDEEIGYSLSIQVLSTSHVDYLIKNNFQFIKNVENQGIII